MAQVVWTVTPRCIFDVRRSNSTPWASNKAPAIVGLRKWLTDAGRATEAMLPDHPNEARPSSLRSGSHLWAALRPDAFLEDGVRFWPATAAWVHYIR
jgi:hypothetical protein